MAKLTLEKVGEIVTWASGTHEITQERAVEIMQLCDEWEQLSPENTRLRNAMTDAASYLSDIRSLAKRGVVSDPLNEGHILDLVRAAQKHLLARFGGEDGEPGKES